MCKIDYGKELIVTADEESGENLKKSKTSSPVSKKQLSESCNAQRICQLHVSHVKPKNSIVNSHKSSPYHKITDKKVLFICQQNFIN